ncbi:ROK family protein [Gilliamella sp. B14384G15]|nr:ROK family protein [Gilliamella sp. B14384G15]MBI0057469.1 ROK family protein [Gilliamella sp. B14384G12]
MILKDNDVQNSNFCGVGIGISFYIFYKESRIMKTTNLLKTKDFPARSYLYKKLGGNIRIMLDNDAHTAALAEHRNGAGRGFTPMLYY